MALHQKAWLHSTLFFHLFLPEKTDVHRSLIFLISHIGSWEANYWRSKWNTYRGISRHICKVTDLSNNLEENYGKTPYLWEFSSLGFCPRQSRSCSVRRWDIYSHRCINSNWLSKNLSLLTCFVNATAQCYTFSLRLKYSLKDCTFRRKKLRSSTARSNK